MKILKKQFWLNLLKDIKENPVSTILSILGVSIFAYSATILYKYYTAVDCILDYNNYNISNTKQLEPNEFGDYFGGVLNPLIGITAAFITFLAFYIQFIANKKITTQFKIQQFESQFYEMLRLHKENVNELTLDQIELTRGRTAAGVLKGWEKETKAIKGRDVFILFHNELDLAYSIINKVETDKEEALKAAYEVFFNGNDVLNIHFNKLNSFAYKHNKNYIERTSGEDIKDVIDDNYILAKYYLFDGHENKLGHYYRHLYHTVKYVVEYNKGDVSYAEKRKYLRLLRAQLSNYEQVMLFYNWFSGYGENWEKNKYFTEFRMIHNLSDKLLFDPEYFGTIKESLRLKNSNYTMLHDKDFLYESDNKR